MTDLGFIDKDRRTNYVWYCSYDKERGKPKQIEVKRKIWFFDLTEKKDYEKFINGKYARFFGGPDSTTNVSADQLLNLCNENINPRYIQGMLGINFKRVGYTRTANIYSPKISDYKEFMDNWNKKWKAKHYEGLHLFFIEAVPVDKNQKYKVGNIEGVPYCYGFAMTSIYTPKFPSGGRNKLQKSYHIIAVCSGLYYMFPEIEKKARDDYRCNLLTLRAVVSKNDSTNLIYTYIKRYGFSTVENACDSAEQKCIKFAKNKIKCDEQKSACAYVDNICRNGTLKGFWEKEEAIEIGLLYMSKCLKNQQDKNTKVKYEESMEKFLYMLQEFGQNKLYPISKFKDPKNEKIEAADFDKN